MNADDDEAGEDGAPWSPPTGLPAPDPDATDDAELEGEAAPLPPPAPTGPPAAVVPLPVDPPVTGQPWVVSAHTAAGVSGLSLEIEGRANNVPMRPAEVAAGTSPTWSGTVDEIGSDPIRYRFVWRSSWNGDVTDWQTATPTAPASPTD